MGTKVRGSSSSSSSSKVISIGNKKQTAVIYVRVSTVEQAECGFSIDAQIERAKAYCHLNSLTVVDVISELGVSAVKPIESRPGGKRLLGLVSQKKACNVVSVKLDRLFRNVINCLDTVQEWDKQKVSLHLVDLGGQSINTGSPMGRFFLTVMSAIGELESRMLGERYSEVKSYKKQHGLTYSAAPYGFTNQGGKLIHNKKEMHVIDTIYALHQRGLTYRKIAEFLNSLGIPTQKGSSWKHTQIGNVLNNSVYGKSKVSSVGSTRIKSMGILPTYGLAGGND